MTFQVEGTNDSSCLSKYSASQRGYFKDDFLCNFVNKCPRRAPLIHLGYTVRAVVINTLIEEFFALDDTLKQVVSFGAGFDTLYFKLKKKNPSINVRYYELDLPRVVERKVQCIQQYSSLQDLIGGYTECQHGLNNENYKLLAVDLRDFSKVKDLLEQYGLDLNTPTLFLSECAITYLEDHHSSGLISLGSKFKHATFVVYEQISPDDTFGLVMTRHFTSLQSPLLTVSQYPTLKLQTQRYISHGWENCTSVTALSAYNSLTTPAERKRVLLLEPFDEWEEFYLKCSHYSVVIASKGSLSNWSRLARETQPASNYRFVVYGGRTAPSKCVNQSPQLVTVCFSRENGHNRLELSSEQLVSECDRPARWRHSAVIARRNNMDTFVVFGGRTSNLEVLNDTWMIELPPSESMSVLPTATEQPCARFSHSAAVKPNTSGWDEVWVSGGLSEYGGGVLDDVWCLNMNSLTWHRLVTPGLLPRFGHSSSVIRDSLVLVGGVGAEPGVAIVNLLTGLTVEYQLPVMSYGQCLLLTSHCHIISADKKALWIVGGGGNCFSFGTFFNKHCALIKLEQFHL